MKHKNNIPRRHIGVTDIDSMDSKWNKEFQQEVAAGNFELGGKSIIMYGEGATEAHEQWAACLALINMRLYFLTPNEWVRRLRGQIIPRDNEDAKESFEQAECYFLADFFEHTPNEEDCNTLYWAIKEAINDGVVIVIATNNEEDNQGLYQYEPIVDLCEQNFEAVTIHNGKATNIKKRNK